MSLRLRLLISYIAMLFIPLVLLPLAALALGYAYVGDLENYYGFDFNRPSLTRMLGEDLMSFEEIKNTAAHQPERLLDPLYLNSLSQKLQSTRSELIVRKNTKLIYAPPNISSSGIASLLPEFGYYRNAEDNHNRHKTNLQDANGRLALRQFDFYFSDRSPGSIFLLTSIGPVQRFLEKFTLSMLGAVIMILVLTNLALTFLVARSITRPIETLKAAALQIKEGNLDFELHIPASDEIGQLYLSFEEMRRQLKSSIQLRLQYEENRKEFLSNVSHDLKTPVTAIKGYTEGLLDGVANSPEKIEKYLRTIHSKADAMDQMIDELMLFSKLDLGKEPFRFERFDLRIFLQNYLEELQLDLEKQAIHLEMSWPTFELPLLVIADQEKLKRVLGNLLDNAVKYMDKETRWIQMGLIVHLESLEISIRDNGQGLPESELAQVFERFYQADVSRTRGGSGLGLSIAQRIVEGQGGKIWIESSVGQGTCVYFTLQRA